MKGVEHGDLRVVDSNPASAKVFFLFFFFFLLWTIKGAIVRTRNGKGHWGIEDCMFKSHKKSKLFFFFFFFFFFFLFCFIFFVSPNLWGFTNKPPPLPPFFYWLHKINLLVHYWIYKNTIFKCRHSLRNEASAEISSSDSMAGFRGIHGRTP